AASESSWFTDSTLYAGFNELKKLVRAGKHLGEGSAEPVYTRLSKEFSAEQIEPVRLYYMSALASAGFEAMSKLLMCDHTIQPSGIYYKRRLAYLIKASELQLKQGEVYQLEDYLKIAEALCLSATDKRILSQGMVDSLSAIQIRFTKSAAYYFLLADFGIDHRTSKQVVDKELVYHLRLGLMDSCFRLAPYWPRINSIKMYEMSDAELDEAFEEKIKILIASDSLNDELLSLATLFYSKHKPYDLFSLQNNIINRVELTSSSEAIVHLLSHVLNLEQIEVDWLSQNFNTEAYSNYYQYELSPNIFSQLINAVHVNLNASINDEFFDPNYFFLLSKLIKYAVNKHKLSEMANVLTELIERVNFDSSPYNQTIISSLIDNKMEYKE
ncbi:MAG: hypothetical protein ACKOSR_10035, partial [Flavobacteriales bacterium]